MTSDSLAAAIKTIDLGVSFAGKTALRNVNIELPGRGLSIIAGRSGSGKTTFLRSINRLNEEIGGRSQGEAYADLGLGLEPIYGPKSRPLTEIRRLAGMVFQTPNVLPATIWKNMSIPLGLIRNIGPTEIQDRIESALKTVGLWPEISDRLHTEAKTLSGGQQQRLCLARALVLEPKIILLDEPTSSLDIAAAARVEETLQKLAEQYPLLVVSHSLSQAWRLADKLHFFHQGKFEKTIGRTEIASERHLAEYIASLDEK